MTHATSLHYVQRINLALDWIVENLEQPLKLQDIARVAHFSPFHFHRIFRALLGETLNQFVRRLRLERALWQLSHKRPRSLTELALACGFASLSDFSRSFKERYGVPPSAFDLDSFRSQRREELEAATLGPKVRRPWRVCLPRTIPTAFRCGFGSCPRGASRTCVCSIRITAVPWFAPRGEW
jgi:AraC family transcriptional regulator